MTERPQNGHLTHDDLLRALVHTGDLPAQQAEHLEGCSICRGELDRLSRRFGKLGRIASQLAPVPGRAFRLPAKAAPARWRIKPLWVAGLTAAVIVLFNGYGPVQVPDIPQQPPSLPASDLELTLVVDALVDNALPPAFRELAAVADPPPDEDLIDRVVPRVLEEKEIL